jgi:hypothetical protein
VQIIGAVLLVWAAITLISGLLLADVGPDIEGRTERFEDTGIAGYGNLAWIGGGIGLVLVLVTVYLQRNEDKAS